MSRGTFAPSGIVLSPQGSRTLLECTLPFSPKGWLRYQLGNFYVPLAAGIAVLTPAVVAWLQKSMSACFWSFVAAVATAMWFAGWVEEHASVNFRKGTAGGVALDVPPPAARAIEAARSARAPTPVQ